MSESKLHMTIPDELKTELKIIAVKKHKTMSEIVIDLITEYVNQNK